MPFEFFEVNSSLSTTLSEQVESEIKAQIANGQLQPGEKLPVMRILSKKLGCGVVTINKALMNLKDQNLLRTEGNKGVFVADLSQDEISLLSNDSLQDKLEEVILIAKQRGINKAEFIKLTEELFDSLEE